MTRTRWFDIAAIALAIAITVGIAVVSCSAGVARPAAAPSGLPNERPRTAADTRPLVLFIGDSYTAGKSSAEMSYGCRAAVQMGWLCALSAVGGTGYISGGAPTDGSTRTPENRCPSANAFPTWLPSTILHGGARRRPKR